MELTAAVISVNVANMLKSELDYNDLQCVYYTDSEIVIGYINNNARRFHVYVGNRIQHIRDRMNPNQWHHVKGKDNPADEASRSMSAKNHLNNRRWFRGPDFLWEADVPLKSQTCPPIEISSDDHEVKSCHSTNSKTVSTEATTLFQNTDAKMQPNQLKLQYFNRFSTWHKVKMWIILIRRGIERFRRALLKRKGEVEVGEHNTTSNTEEQTVQEFQNAEKIILQSLQHEYFSEEIKLLQRLEGKQDKFTDREAARNRNQSVKKKSSLYRLDPFVDEDGLLRVGGRMSGSDAPYEIKHPLILPRQGHITQLVVRHFHEQILHHQGSVMCVKPGFG
ncbi:hypothetical protein QZH41_005901 [Actinostola sp. cb2023]|nr:hypothetical protein QZH41_005901 [Actinostola sp. cb2023]